MSEIEYDAAAARNFSPAKMIRIRSIVLTGGPGAGKTRAAAALAGRWPDRIAVVPEAATQIYRGLGTRWSELDVAGRREVQRRIYKLQIEQEARIRRRYPDRILLLDRGTVDGAAYWPEGPADYWKKLGTSAEAELGRYDAVIWLQSTAALGTYAQMASNRWRSETADGARQLDRILRQLWQGHKEFHCIEACPHFDRKLAAINAIVSQWVA